MKQGTNCYFENGKIILLNQKIKLNKKVQLITFILLRRLMNLKIKCNKMSPKEKIHGSNYITSSTCRRNKDSDGKRKKTRRRKHEEEKKKMEDRGWTLKDLDLEATEPGYRLH